MDRKRVNEFGFGGEDAQLAEAEAEGTHVPASSEDEKKTNWVDVKLCFG